MNDSDSIISPYKNHRRLAAIQPYINADSWHKYHSIQDLRDKYDGSWKTGSVDFDGNPLDFSIRPRLKSRRLVVVFNSQQSSADKIKLFTWEKVAARFEWSVLHISDPTLYASEHAKLGWYTSNHFRSFQKDIELLISSIKNSLNITEMLFVGSSGGGFPAALLAQHFPHSSTLLLAPTLSVYNSFQKEPTEEFLEDLNKVTSFDELSSRWPNLELSIPHFLSSRRREITSSINILQSRNDNPFWANHTQGFLAELGRTYETPPSYVTGNHFSCLFGNWSDGHAPPPISVLNSAVDFLRAVPLGSLADTHLPESLLHVELS